MKINRLSNPIKTCDLIGPDIRLYNIQSSGTNQQTTIGGLLSIIVVSLSVATSTYFFTEILIRSNPKAYQVTRFEDDVPKLNFDKNGMFFGIQFRNPLSPKLNMSNERAFDFFGVMKTFKTNELVAEYKFGKCNYTDDFAGIENLFTTDMMSEINDSWLCIHYMTNGGKLIYRKDPGFIDPYTVHGMGSKKKDPIYFEVGANRCKNTTENKNKCLPKEEISKMLVGSNYKINFVDNMFDTNNYVDPVSKFVHQIDGQGSPTNFAANYMNLLNIDFRTHDGLVFDNVNEKKSYQFNDRVEIVSPILEDSPNVGRIFMFRLELQNTPKVYERYYTRVQEVMGSIGGVLKFLFVAAKIINYLLTFVNDRKILLKSVFSNYLMFSHLTEIKSLPLHFLQSKNQLGVANKIFQRIEAKSNEVVNTIETGKHIKPNDALDESMKISLPSFITKTFRREVSKKEDAVLKNLDISNFLIKKILNEKTLYKIFFEMEKLKLVLFNKNQMDAFNFFKLELSDINKVGNSKTMNLDLYRLEKSKEKVDQALYKLIERTHSYYDHMENRSNIFQKSGIH